MVLQYWFNTNKEKYNDVLFLLITCLLIQRRETLFIIFSYILNTLKNICFVIEVIDVSMLKLHLKVM